MAEFGWIKMSFLLIPVLQIAAVSEQHPLFFVVRFGHKVTLPCENVTDDHLQCDSTTWVFSSSENSVTLFEQKQNKSDRVTVTENCSLVIKKVTAEDAGYYSCSQFDKSGQQQGSGSQVHLSVVNMTKHKKKKREVTFNCSVSTNEECGYKVKWLYLDKDVDKDNNDIKTSQSTCSANVTIKTSHFISKKYELLKCKVTDSYTGEVHLFTLEPPSSGRKPGGRGVSGKSPVRTTEKSVTVETNRPKSAAKKSQDWWRYIAVAVGLAALLILVVAVVTWIRTKANRARMVDNMELTSDPSVIQSPPGTSQDTADPEDGVSYASISYTNKTNSKAPVCGGDEAVTYSTVRAPSSSAGTSADHSDLYATIN